MKPNLCLINNILFLVFVLEKPFIFLLYNVGPALSCIPLVLLFCLRVMTSCHHMISIFFFSVFQVWECEASLAGNLYFCAAVGREVYQVHAGLFTDVFCQQWRITILSLFGSPMLRMSFIVFSTHGKIILKLTENRLTQQPALSPKKFHS